MSSANWIHSLDKLKLTCSAKKKKKKIKSMLFLGTERCTLRALAVGKREERRLINRDKEKKMLAAKKGAVY